MPRASRAKRESGTLAGRRGKLASDVVQTKPAQRAESSDAPREAQIVERTLPIAMLCLSLIAVPILVLEPAGLPRLHSLEKELDEVTAENAESVREVERLRVEVRELRDDPAAVERIARGELGMVRKSEVVFQFGK
jgi:cell division protein FtsB